MAKYNHQAGLKRVGEVLPDERNQVTLADETDELDLKIPRVTFSYADNDKRLIRHALRRMHECLAAGGASDLWDQNNVTCHLPPAWNLLYGRRPTHQRRQFRLPQLGHPQSVDM
jgi:hypothetical protein